jgi:chaperonin GroEL
VATCMNPIGGKIGVDIAVDALLGDLGKQSKKVWTNEEIVQVGAISANCEGEVGDRITEAMQQAATRRDHRVCLRHRDHPARVS